MRMQLLSRSEPFLTCRSHLINPPGVFPPDTKTHMDRSPSFLASLFPSFQEPLKNNSRALGALLIWSRRAGEKKKSELYFLQNTDQRGRNWPCFGGPFTSNLCLFSSFSLLLQFLSTCSLRPVFSPPCHYLSRQSHRPPFTLSMFLSVHSSLSLSVPHCPSICFVLFELTQICSPVYSSINLGVRADSPPRYSQISFHYGCFTPVCMHVRSSDMLTGGLTVLLFTTVAAGE